MTSAFSWQNFVRLCPASFYTPDLALELGLLMTHPGFGFGDENDAILASKSVISSSLVKSAIFGGDPNWGRIVAAVGYSGCEMNQDMISVSVNSDDGKEAILVDKGKILAFEGTDELNSAEEIMQEKTVNIVVDLYQGDASATAWGCDLTYDYVKINAEYTT